MTYACIVKTFTSFVYSIFYDKSVVFKQRYLLLINVLIDFYACTELIWSMIREYWIKPRQRLNPLWNRGLMQRQLFHLFDTGVFLNRAYWNNPSNYFMTKLHEFCVSNRVYLGNVVQNMANKLFENTAVAKKIHLLIT